MDMLLSMEQLIHYTMALYNLLELNCGKAYIIVLKEGTDSIEIDNFVFTDASVNDAGRIIDTCINKLTPSPIEETPTPIVETPTPIVETPTPTEQWIPNPDDCFCSPASYDTYLITSGIIEFDSTKFVGFPIGTEISFDNNNFETSGILASTVNFRYTNNTASVE